MELESRTMAKTKKATEKTTDKETALQRVLAQIEKQYGQGAIMQMDEHSYAKIQGISTGSLSLDLALGGVGLPKGRVTELFGPESSGKTTLALHTIANCQKDGGVAAFIDAEHALDPTWAKKLGVDVSSLLISQPDTGEQAMEIVEMLIRSNSIDIIVVDSVAALTPKAEIEGEMGDRHIGLQARLMSQAMRKLTAVISKSKTALIFLNWFIPALAKSSVLSSMGTIGELGTNRCPFSSKNSINLVLISFAVSMFYVASQKD